MMFHKYGGKAVWTGFLLGSKDQSFTCCFIWVWNTVSYINGRKYTEYFWEKDAQNIWP
jgi:hypothetical protein